MGLATDTVFFLVLIDDKGNLNSDFLKILIQKIQPQTNGLRLDSKEVISLLLPS
jgi:hypothetical protein